MIFSDMLNTQTITNTKNPKMPKTKLRQNHLPANTVWIALDSKNTFNIHSQGPAKLKNTHCVNAIDFGSSDVCKGSVLGIFWWHPWRKELLHVMFCRFCATCRVAKLMTPNRLHFNDILLLPPRLAQLSSWVEMLAGA